MLREARLSERVGQNIYTGFRWLVERADQEPFGDPALVRAIHAALSATGSRLAGDLARRQFASWLLSTADQLARTSRAVCELRALTLSQPAWAGPVGASAANCSRAGRTISGPWPRRA